MLQQSCELLERLETACSGEFKNKNLKLTVKLLLKNLYPRRFKEIVAEALEYQNSMKLMYEDLLI